MEHSSRRGLSGGLTVSLMMIGSIWVQQTFGGSQGASVAPLMLPALISVVLMVIFCLLFPQKVGASIASVGEFIESPVAIVSRAGRERINMLGWCVKCLFLPLMLGSTLTWLQGLFAELPTQSMFVWFSVPMAAMYAIDTAFASIGYMSTTRRLDAHIRSVDNTWLGWLSALSCYPPLSVLVFDVWLIYKGSNDWIEWLHDGTFPASLWGGAILLLTGIYTWATIAFGPRFSNLTNRGIITHGPYRWGKHPAYLCKNLSWWMISVPFLPSLSGGQTLAHCLSLLAINGIYFVRARTEERHLLQDSVYRQYSAWIAEYGLFARVLQMFRRRAGDSV
ncbi:isoprenylcysteine carboxylmethyltransferase family protein [Stenotrophomonas sp. CC120223-11]|uniref:isoprenylcysteine carboxylmethyltransferase family protein n=1 Tax=Stenotrophomonas sp. CC120223-11 TaxID=1378090 RepID=UPI0015964180|nr:isoprenylcysteine carboxylmethyltransferase family protein [Stenotrophomonas sp. CC120223-11]